MRFSVLSSGSKANCTYLEIGGLRALIDCGLSGRQVERRLTSLGINSDSIQAIFVTHEHNDHVRGVPTLSRQLRIPVYANEATANHLQDSWDIRSFTTDEPFHLHGVCVNAIPISHDAVEPVGYTFEADAHKFAQVTDLGRIPSDLPAYISDADALVIESNHDTDLLFACNYPWVLKERIASPHGHLSNHSAARFVSQIAHPKLQHIVLAHLSENSNTPELALRAFAEVLSPDYFSRVRCASVKEPTPLLHFHRDYLTPGYENVVGAA